MKRDVITALRARISVMERNGASARREVSVLSTSLGAVDNCLAEGGLARGSLHEVWDGASSGHAAAAAAWIGGLLATCAGPVLWCGRDLDLYGPGLSHLGFSSDRLLLVKARCDQDVLWALEEGLRHGELAAVVGEAGCLDLTASRRLQLAAQASGVAAFVLRRPRRQKEKEQDVTAAETRWRITPVSSSSLSISELGRPRWRLELLRARNGRTGDWIIEYDYETHHFRLPAELEHRPQILDELQRKLAATG